MTVTTTSRPSLASLARPGGGFAMVAMDQRESLRQMIADATGATVPDETLVRFKLAVAREVGVHASGFLIDTAFGFDAVAAEPVLPPTAGLIVAADRLVQHAGGPVEDTAIDDDVDLGAARAAGAVAAKLLVIWADDAERGRRIEMSAEFARRCADAGLLSVVEGVTRPADTAAVVAAARDLAAVRPDLYKAQVPLCGRAAPDVLAAACARLDAAIPVPWVVLSQGVDRADFADAVRIACRSGASGMLAGRAIWSDLVGVAGTAELPDLLRGRALPRLRALQEIVDADARPWSAREGGTADA
jgi:sulfofructosephosphate aldolase